MPTRPSSVPLLPTSPGTGGGEGSFCSHRTATRLTYLQLAQGTLLAVLPQSQPPSCTLLCCKALPTHPFMPQPVSCPQALTPIHLPPLLCASCGDNYGAQVCASQGSSLSKSRSPRETGACWVTIPAGEKQPTGHGHSSGRLLVSPSREEGFRGTESSEVSRLSMLLAVSATEAAACRSSAYTKFLCQAEWNPFKRATSLAAPSGSLPAFLVEHHRVAENWSTSCRVAASPAGRHEPHGLLSGIFRQAWEGADHTHILKAGGSQLDTQGGQKDRQALQQGDGQEPRCFWLAQEDDPSLFA